MSSIAHMLASTVSDPPQQAPTQSEQRPPLPADDDDRQQAQHQHQEQQQAQHQRKRSKVSRACDECRRKKVRCDATFSTTANTVLRPCSNCSKNKDTCSFERVPLKRGPTKGFARSDPVSDAMAERSRAPSFQQQNIVLPPLTSLTRPADQSQPDSPRSSIVFGDNTVPQGMFWKVPYQGSFERRGSIDSVNSSSTTGGGYRAYESSVISDSDDDAASHRRSRSNSSNLQVPVSPSLSINSLRSLNQGFTKKLTLDPQLVELYYQFIHPSFPILPLNKQSLSNLLAIPPASSPEVSDTNGAITHTFYLSLEALVAAASRSSSRNDDIYNLFSSLFRIFAKVHSSTNLYSQNVIILIAASLIMLCYTLTLLGLEADVNLHSTVAVFNKRKFFKLFWDKSHVVTNNNYDDYNSLVKRLYVQLSILDTLQSISSGIPKCMNVNPEISTVDALFPNFANFELTKNNMKLGLMLTQLSYSKDYTKPFQTVTCPKSSALVREVDQDGLTCSFWDVITCKYELMSFLDELIKEPAMDEEALFDFQLKCSRIVKKNLSVQGALLSSVKNYTNSIDTNMLVSPYLPLMFKQSIKLLNVNKVIINSLQMNKDLVSRLSKLLNDVISLTNYLSLIKPFRLDEMNNHLRFDFKSPHLAWFEEDEVAPSASHWVGLMKDIDGYLRSDDYDGWF